jgi:hypothetical protein
MTALKFALNSLSSRAKRGIPRFARDDNSENDDKAKGRDKNNNGAAEAAPLQSKISNGKAEPVPLQSKAKTA